MSAQRTPSTPAMPTMAYPRSRAIKVSAVRKSQEFEQVSNIEKIADRLKARLKSK